jgi:hypothetical protein
MNSWHVEPQSTLVITAGSLPIVSINCVKSTRFHQRINPLSGSTVFDSHLDFPVAFLNLCRYRIGTGLAFETRPAPANHQKGNLPMTDTRINSADRTQLHADDVLVYLGALFTTENAPNDGTEDPDDERWSHAECLGKVIAQIPATGLRGALVQIEVLRGIGLTETTNADYRSAALASIARVLRSAVGGDVVEMDAGVANDVAADVCCVLAEAAD